MVDPIRISAPANTAMQGPRALGPPDSEQQARQIREADQLQLSAESEQVAELQSGRDVTEGQGQRSSNGAQQQQPKKMAGNDMPVSTPGHVRDAGKQLDVQG
ncbi:MAG: hypothetical protein GY917_14070 [Planctomycetaceae bacterium]|nr:hypothetical protein [Planctomycetaceae bacterium]MCP4816936.1 hypothetical protein [Planctomycetaceae bacterium]